MEPTKLKYIDDSYLFNFSATFLKVTAWKNKEAIILDETIFYPQGGGSPYDKGLINNDKGIFRVDEVRFNDGLVYHIGEFTSGKFEPGELVNLQIDKERRILNCRLQSAGHLIDEAVRNIGLIDLIPTKGFHFPEGAYVEYQGVIPEDKREEIKNQLESELKRMIKEGFEVKTAIVSKENLPEICHFVPENLPVNKPLRVVVIWGEKGIPCGANHVKNIHEIRYITVRKIKMKGNTIKIGYEI